MSSRDSILRRVRAALADVPAVELPEDVAVPREYLPEHVAADDDLVGLFAGRVADYRAVVTTVSSGTVAHAVAAALDQAGVRTVVVPAGFPHEWLASAYRVEVLIDDITVTTAELDEVDAILTTAAVAIAVTGTVVLDGGPGQGRRAATLLPDRHVCVIRADQIVGDVPEALTRLTPTCPLTFISGPSATSDIENNRIEGVHGPRDLHLILVTPDPKETDEP